jgi:hypothetical protein
MPCVQRTSDREAIILCSFPMLIGFYIVATVVATTHGQSRSAEAAAGASKEVSEVESDPTDVLSPEKWERVDKAVDRALEWLASQRRPDGSFPTVETGQPGVTSLCLLAFMAHGHMSGEGKYGERLARAVKFVQQCQKPNGLVTLIGPDKSPISRQVSRDVGTSAAYNHAISSLTIGEFYGMSESSRSDAMKEVIARALKATLEMQRWPKDQPEDRGGWRYIDEFDHWDSDVSITGWNLMFLRSARNAGFDVPKGAVDDAVAYIRRSFTKEYGVFEYIISPADTRSRGMAGAGILALAHAGLHDSEEAKKSGEWLLKQSFAEYNGIEPFDQPGYKHDRYHYALFNSCQGMYQLGGRYWKEFFPPLVRTVLDNQQKQGSWPADTHMFDSRYGNAYTTALVLLSLGAPNQLLPIFQR